MTNEATAAGTGGAVTASSEAAVAAGHAALADGGNAVDAAVTAALASCVADHCNTGLGGYGGHMVIAPPHGPAVTVDFNAWQPGRFDDAAIAAPVAINGPQSSCVANVVAGLHLAVTAHGLRGWERACLPAIDLAERGVAMNDTTASAFDDAEGFDFVDACFRFETLDGTTWFRQPDLANTLRGLAERGPEWFYEGPIADTFAAAFRRAGRELTAADWAGARESVAEAPASCVRVGDAELALAPLGVSGSISAAATMAAGARVLEAGAPETAEGTAEWAERIAGVWAHRMARPGSNDFSADTDLAAWIEQALAAAPVATLKPDSGHTCHLNTADADGTLVAVTLTHGPQWFGARWALPGTGLIMNSGMALFAAAPARRYNDRAYAVTNMSPTVARSDDGARIAVGCPGARRIPANVGMMLARHLHAGQDLPAAVAGGRVHAETTGRAGLESERLPAGSADALGARFGRVSEEDWRHYFGPLTAIRRDPDGTFQLGLDDRPVRGYGNTGAPAS